MVHSFSISSLPTPRAPPKILWRELPADGHGMLVRSSVRLSRPQSVQPPLVPCRPRLLSAIAECLPHIAERARRWSVLRASPDVCTVTTRRGVDVSTPDDRSYLSAMHHHARAAVPLPAARRVTYPLQQRCDLCRPLVAERQSTRLLQLLPRSKLDRGGSFQLMGMACSCGAAASD